MSHVETLHQNWARAAACLREPDSRYFCVEKRPLEIGNPKETRPKSKKMSESAMDNLSGKQTLTQMIRGEVQGLEVPNIIRHLRDIYDGYVARWLLSS